MLNYSAATSFILKIALFNLRGIVFVQKKNPKKVRTRTTEKLFQQQKFVNNLHHLKFQHLLAKFTFLVLSIEYNRRLMQ